MTQRLVWASVALVLALFVGAFRFLSIAGFSNDHYMHMAAAQQISMGEWPSRDYVELGLPLMELLSAIPFWVLPHAPLFGEAVLVAAMFGLAVVFTLYAARRLTGSLWIALLVIALEVVIFPRTYSYPKILAYAAGLLAMWRYVETPSPSRMIQLAVAVVVALGLRYDHGLYLGVGGLLTVIVVEAYADRVKMVRRAAVFAGIVFAWLLPYIAYVAVHEGLWRHIVRGIELEIVESSRGRGIPSFTLDTVDVSSNAVPWLFFVFHLLPAVAAVAAWRHWRGRHDAREQAMVAPLIVVAVLANAGLIRDTLSARLPDAVVPASLLLGWLLALAIRLPPSPGGRLTRAVAAAVVAMTMASATTVGATKEQLDKAEMLGSPSRLWRQLQSRSAELHERLPLAQIPSRVVSTLLPFLRYADRCLLQHDRILIPAFAPEVTVWSRRPFAGGQAWFQPELLKGDDDHRDVMRRLESQRVPVAILLSPSAGQVVARFADLGRYLDQHFPERAVLTIDDGREVAVAFNDRFAVGRDHETGWFCYR
jgi:hypothetical protein